MPGRRTVAAEAADGYDAVQLAFEPVADRKITKGELGHLEEGRGRRAHRHARRVPRRRREPSTSASTVTVEAFEPGDKIKVAGTRHRQGLPGHDQAAQLQPRPRRARLAQRPQARLDRRLGDAVARLQGHEDGRAAWAASASPSSGSSSTRSTPSATCCSSRAPSRARRAASSRSGGVGLMAAAEGSTCSAAADEGASRSTAAVFGAELEAAPRARGRARGAERAPRGHAAAPRPAGSSPAAARSRGARRAPAVPARARSARPQFTGGGVAFAPGHAQLRRQGEPQGAPRRARCARSRTTSATRRSRLVDGDRVRDAVDEAGARRCVEVWGRRSPLVVVAHEDEEALIKSFRNLDARARHGAGRARGGADRLGALARSSARPRCRSWKGRRR